MAYGFGGGFAEGLQGGMQTASTMEDAKAKRAILQQEQSQRLIQDTVAQVNGNVESLGKTIASIRQDGPEVEKIKGTYSQALNQAIDSLEKMPGGQKAASLLRQQVSTSILAMRTMSQTNMDEITSEFQGKVGAQQSILGNAVKANQQQVAQAGPGPQGAAPGTVNAGGFASDLLPGADGQSQVAAGPGGVAPGVPGAPPPASGPGMPGAMAAPAQDGMMQPPPGAPQAQPAVQNFAKPAPKRDRYGLPEEDQGGLITVTLPSGETTQIPSSQAESLLGSGMDRKDMMDVYKTRATEMMSKLDGLEQTVRSANDMKKIAESGDLVSGPGAKLTIAKLETLATFGQLNETQSRQYQAIKKLGVYSIRLAAARLKAFGSGSAVSDRDVEYSLLGIGFSDALTPESIAQIAGGLVRDSYKDMVTINKDLKAMQYFEGMRDVPDLGSSVEPGDSSLGILPAQYVAEASAIISNAQAEGRELNAKEMQAITDLAHDAAKDPATAERANQVLAGEQKGNSASASPGGFTPPSEGGSFVMFEGKKYWVPKNGDSN